MQNRLTLVSILLLAACGGAPDASSVHTLPKGGETLIAFPSDDPMMVTFGFELGSESWDATGDCPEQNVGSAEDPFMMQLCGELVDANAAPGDFAAGFRGMHGGGVTFHPKDGVIRVRLKNLAHREMDFQVEFEPEDA